MTTQTQVKTIKTNLIVNGVLVNKEPVVKPKEDSQSVSDTSVFTTTAQNNEAPIDPMVSILGSLISVRLNQQVVVKSYSRERLKGPFEVYKVQTSVGEKTVRFKFDVL